MAGAFWCVVEDDRQGQPKKVMAEVLGEARAPAARRRGRGGVAHRQGHATRG